MSVKYMGLSHVLIRELIFYDPITGHFIDLVGSGSRKIGSVITSNHTEGYISINLLGRKLMAHRLAVFYMTGELPPDDVDHINGIRNCNVYANLRCVSRSVNMQNMRGPKTRKSGRTSQYLGVSFIATRNKWLAQIKLPGGKRLFIGRFDNELDAYRAYVDMKRKVHEGNML